MTRIQELETGTETELDSYTNEDLLELSQNLDGEEGIDKEENESKRSLLVKGLTNT